jgi:hypothetical protein
MARCMFGLVFLFKRKGLCKKIGSTQISLSRYYERYEGHSEIQSTPGSRFQYVHTYFTTNFFNEFSKIINQTFLPHKNKPLLKKKKKKLTISLHFYIQLHVIKFNTAANSNLRCVSL